MRGDLDEVLRVEEDASPRRYVGRESEAEEREGRLGEDRAADTDRRGDEDRRKHVRQDVAGDDPPVGVPDGPRGFDELLLLEREELRAHQSRDRHPLQHADDGDDHDEDPELGTERRPQRVAEQIDDHQQKRQDR